MYLAKVFKEIYYQFLKVAWFKQSMVLLTLNICYLLVLEHSTCLNQVI
ncbi:Uncharacterised protein [Mycobacteroides abscessus]|nr:Uncharacterised protein [Mycobacteroides abscessus]